MSRTREAFFKPRSIMILAAAVVATVVLLPVVVFALAPPTVLTAVAGQAEPTIARLNWKASTSADAARYVVSVATSADGPFKVVGSTEATGYDFKDGLGGVTYYFRVAAVNVLGELSPPEVAGPVKATWVSDPHAPATRTTNKCASCHVPHSAQASPLMRTEISTDTPGQEATCLTCHDGKIATAGNIADGTKDSFALASGHALDTTISAGGLTNNCASCHDPHRTANASPMIPQAKINGNQVSLAGKEWCLACHDDNNSWYPDPSTYPTASVPQRDGAGYPTLGTWLGKTAYNDAGNAHRLVPETTYTAGSGQQVRRGQGDCLYCHAAHRGTNAYDGLLGTYRPTTPSTLAADKEQGDYAAACFTCHGGVTPSGFATAPVDIKGFVTSGGTTSGHSIVTSGGLLPVGAPLPCYECHNPHGSKRGNDSMLSDVLGGSLTTSGSPSAVRQFCFTCHTTAGTAKGWDSAAATYTAVAVGDKVVGIPRIGGGELDGVLDLPSISGHGQDDATSCYQCHGSDYGQPNSNNVHNPNLGGYDTATHTAAPLAEFVMISGMSYGPVVCADCHNTLLSTEHEKVTSSSAGGGCATCHPTPKNTLTPSWDKSCAQGGCHTASSSAPMHGNIDTSHVPVAGQTCYAAGCHPASGTDSLAETHVLASAVLGGQTRTSCQVCHWNGIPASGECASCHADRVDGTHGAGTSHAFTAGSDAVIAGDAGCTNSGTGCHGIDATRLSFASYHLNNGCTAGVCHSSTSKPGYAGNGDCQSCHDASFAGAPARADLGTQHYNETTHTATGLSATVSAGGSASATCATCHDPNPAVGPKGLAAQHTNITPVADSPYGTTVACVECHNDIRAGGNAEVLMKWRSNSCSGCHSIASSVPQHGTTAPVVAATSAESCGASGTNCHTTYDVHALHKDAVDGCTLAGCHDATKQALKPTLKTCGQAGGCHATYTSTTHAHAADAALHAPTDATQASASFASNTCDACHVVAAVDGGLDAEHSLSTSVKTTNANVCLNCHNNVASTTSIVGNWSAKDTTSACASCHTGALAIHDTVDTARHAAASSAGCAATGIGCHNTAVLSAVGADKSANIHDTCLRCHDRTATSPNLAFDPAKNTCASCHAAGSYSSSTSIHNGTGGTADGTDATHHTATMTVSAYASVYAGGQACSSCHSSALKTAHTASSAGSVTCAGCHNDTTLDSATQVKANWANDRCTDCHATASVHTAYETAGGIAASHRATSTASCGASGVGCHITYDLGTLHAGTPGGCATCHATDKNMAVVSKTCGQATGCHSTGSFHAGVSGNDTTHTATAMEAVVDSGSGYSGNTCADCHTATLKTAHDKAGPTSNLGWTNECTDCHNSTSPVDGTSVVTGGWAPKVCATCHTTSHNTYATDHTGQPTGTNTCSGCHTNDSLDLRVVHKNAITVGSPTDTGCGINGCHKATDSSPASKTCGTGGACHTDKIDGNHGSASAHAFSSASDFNSTTVSGCTNSGAGCHGTETAFGNFVDYHPTTGCMSGACHISPSKATYAGNHDCVSCHDGNYTNAPDVVGLTAASPNGHYNETTHAPTGMSTSINAGGTQSAACNDCHNGTSATTVDQLYAQHQGIGATVVNPPAATGGFSDGFESNGFTNWTSRDYTAPISGSVTVMGEGFESAGSWTTVNGTWTASSTDVSLVSSGARTGSYRASIYRASGGSTARTLTSPAKNTTAGTAQLTFYYQSTDLVTPAFGVDTYNGTSWATNVWSTTTKVASPGWQLVTVALPAASNMQFRFSLPAGAAANRTVYVDDVTVTTGGGASAPAQGWSTVTTASVGTYGAQALGQGSTVASMTKTGIVTANAASVNVSYDVRWANLETADDVIAQYTINNGSSWADLKNYTPAAGTDPVTQAWKTETITGLPAATNGVRFGLLADTPSDDVLYIDNVSVTPVSAVGGTFGGTSVTCSDCHNSTAKAISLVSSAVAWNDQCNACHNSADMPTFSANHLTSVPAVTGSSTQGCATTGAGCHATNDLHAIHKGNGGAADPTCNDCHDYTSQAAKPAGTTCGVGGTCHNASTYTATDHAKTGDDALHTATAMTASIDTTYNTGGGNLCSSCHSPGLKSAHTTVTATLDSGRAAWTTPFCTDCHNSASAEANSVTTIKTNSWSAQTCDQCHVTNGNGKHTTFTLAKHTATLNGGCTASSAGCHKTADVRTIHNKVGAGCTATGADSKGSVAACHALNKAMPTAQIACGSGGCHANHTNSNHGMDHNSALAAGTAVGILSGQTYKTGQNVGCFGCHYADLTLEHGPTSMSTTTTPGANRTKEGGAGGTDGCGVCHTDKGTAGTYSASANVASAITNGDFRCVSCHTQSADNATGAKRGHLATTTAGSLTQSATINATMSVTAEFEPFVINGYRVQSGHMAGPASLSLPMTWNGVVLNGVTRTAALASQTGYTGTNPRTSATWKDGDTVLCADCHMQPTTSTGPQGASVPFYIRGAGSASTTYTAYPTGYTHWYLTAAPTMPAPCSNCHLRHAGTVAVDGAHNVACENCHIRIPHAWKRPALLRRIAGGTLNGVSQDTLPYANPTLNTTNQLYGVKITSSMTYIGSNKTNCYSTGTNCSDHSAASTPYWP